MVSASAERVALFCWRALFDGKVQRSLKGAASGSRRLRVGLRRVLTGAVFMRFFARLVGPSGDQELGEARAGSKKEDEREGGRRRSAEGPVVGASISFPQPVEKLWA